MAKRKEINSYTSARYFTDNARLRVVLMGQHGFSAQAIKDSLRVFDGIRVKLTTIYGVLQYEGIRLYGYRHGKTTLAKQALAQIGVARKKVG